MRGTYRFILGVLVIVSLLLAACGPKEATPEPADTTGQQETVVPTEAAATEAPEPAETEPTVLRIRVTDVSNLDPAFIVGGSDNTVDSALLEGLITYQPSREEYKTVNQLAEWLEVSEDGLEIHFKLREGVMWHNGYGELTTEDVKFSFERFIDPELAAAYADDWSALDHVEIIDKYEGKIILKEAQATLWTTTLPLTSGSIVCKKQVEEVGVEAFATNVVGTGPYVLTEFAPNERVVLDRNPDYWGEQPAYDQIQLIMIDDDKAAEVALEAGELDFGIVSLASASRFEGNSDFEVIRMETNTYSWLGMNIENPKLADINVRQAIRYGVDVPSILMATYLGQAEPAKTILPPGMLGYWEDAPLYQRDVAKAKEYMAAAGLESLDLQLAIEDTTESRTWAEIIQQNLAEVGINIIIEPLDASAYWVLGEGDKGKEVGLFAMTYSSLPDPAWFMMWFTCDQVGVWNWMRWCSPEFDELHYKGIATLDQAERSEIYVEMQKLWDEAAHTVWITHAPVVLVSSTQIVPAIYPNFHNYYPLPAFKLAE